MAPVVLATQVSSVFFNNPILSRVGSFQVLQQKQNLVINNEIVSQVHCLCYSALYNHP